MFVIDAAGSEGRDPVEDLISLKEELRLYDVELSGKPAFVVANKTDLRGGCPSAGRTRAHYCTMYSRMVLPVGWYSLGVVSLSWSTCHTGVRARVRSSSARLN